MAGVRMGWSIAGLVISLTHYLNYAKIIHVVCEEYT